MDGVGWGIVGYGWVARDYMAPGIRAAGHRLVAVSDPNPESRAAAEREGARAHADLAGLIAEPAVEAVYVATPNHLHRGAVEALAATDGALLVAGSSLAVMSGLRFVKRAAKNGTPVVIVNRGTTRGDDLATLKLEAGVTETLAALRRAFSR